MGNSHTSLREASTSKSLGKIASPRVTGGDASHSDANGIKRRRYFRRAGLSLEVHRG